MISKLLLLFPIIGFCLSLLGQPPEKKKLLINLPTSINQKAIATCFDKMVGVVTTQDASDLNSLRVTLERIYQLPKAFLVLRQLEFKKESGKRLVYEFNAIPNSKPGSETYHVENYEFGSKGQIENSTSQSQQQTISRAQLDKFLIDDELIKDERSEEYKLLNSRTIKVKSINFKVQEIESYDNKTKKNFTCRLLDEHQPLCQCL
jgi:hypothetical protein